MKLNDYYEALVNFCVATQDEINLVIDINGYSTETLDAILYARTGYRSWSQYAEAELDEGEFEDEDDGEDE